MLEKQPLRQIVIYIINVDLIQDDRNALMSVGWGYTNLTSIYRSSYYVQKTTATTPLWNTLHKDTFELCYASMKDLIDLCEHNKTKEWW